MSARIEAPKNSEEGVRGRFERIYQALRTRICMLDYAPGSRLREEDLAEEFGVSRTPLRRVLVKLEAEGLLRSVHGVGTIVTDIDINELAQVYELRIELAELVGKLSPVAIDAAMVERFRDIRERCDQMVTAGDPREFSRINMEFFHLFTTLTTNEPLRAISERLYYQTARIWLKTASRLESFDELLQKEFVTFQREVADITEAVEHGDLVAAGHVRRAHIAMSFRRIRRASGGA
ncbi:GntR family transcriptional regulator [Aliihoeflea sp. 40Bstr573]|uniref:GntR family transcriptional regulator n=1 Tax=Aliihoeflea sp. 40Bstr573 TaxID=2696467 RepID=UPI002094AA59|nr:GntR family transcriptional regulator [Aliihoeflea sp. 40Bstr573]MCO6385991.1 GntR family transcriptional regulator [Aliihoeflea sp. 40Bstr573]